MPTGGVRTARPEALCRCRRPSTSRRTRRSSTSSAILRDEATEPKKFREVVRELSWLLGYEALADARVRPLTIRTPIEEMEAAELGDRIGLVPILRAGLGMVDAMLELMPTAEVWHLGLFRDERTLRPVEYYNKLPDSASVDLCLILDPMLATGGSATAAIEVLKRWGAVEPVRIKLVNLIAAPEGVARGRRRPIPDVEIYCAALDRAAQREGLHHAGPRRRRRPPVRDGPLRPAGRGGDTQPGKSSRPRTAGKRTTTSPAATGDDRVPSADAVPPGAVAGGQRAPDRFPAVSRHGPAASRCGPSGAASRSPTAVRPARTS